MLSEQFLKCGPATLVRPRQGGGACQAQHVEGGIAQVPEFLASNMLELVCAVYLSNLGSSGSLGDCYGKRLTHDALVSK